MQILSPTNRGTINVVRSIRNLHIGFKKNVILINEDSVLIDLGTPNLGTVWDITFLSLLFREATYKNNILPTTEGTCIFDLRTELLIAGVPQFQEAVSESTETDTRLHHFNILGLQNLSQTVRVYGGQQVTLNIILAFDPETVISADTNTNTGQLTMGYDLLDFHH